jgi:hypothetical protein
LEALCRLRADVRRLGRGWRGREEIAERNPKNLAQLDEVIAWHRLGRSLVGFEPADLDAERLGQIVLGQPKSPSLASDPPAYMLINRCHARSPPALFIRHSFVNVRD